MTPRLLYITVATLLLLTGCSDQVTAVSGTEKPFTLYGLLTPDLPTQKVLVYPIEARLETRGTEPLSAVMTSVDLTTGNERTWRDSLVTDSTGLHDHLFVASFRAEYGHTYRLTVRRPDGASSEVETTVPPETDVVTGDPITVARSIALPAYVIGDAPQLNKIVVTYYVNYQDIRKATHRLRLAFPYDGTARKVSDGWMIPVQLSHDYKPIWEDVKLIANPNADDPSAIDQVNWEYGIRVHRIRLQLIVASEEWVPPRGEFDPEVIIEPGTMSNVENGYGFVAAGYRFDRDLDMPDGKVLREAGFTPDAGQ